MIFEKHRRWSLLACTVLVALLVTQSALAGEPSNIDHKAIETKSVDAKAVNLSAESEILSQQFAKALKSKLIKAMSQGGVTNAISVCKNEAPLIASQLARQSGAKIQRVSLKYRNPLNMPSEWQRDVLAYFDKNPYQTDKYYAESNNGNVRFMQAIKTDEICLACHGKNLSKEVEDSLRANYPNDVAIGYSRGENRGAFSVEWDSISNKSSGIINLKQVSNNLIVAGQPRLEQITELKEVGVKTVINLRPEKEHSFDEKNAVLNLKMNYLSLPVDGEQGITFENSAKLQTMIASVDGPILLHCSSSSRVGALLALDAISKGYELEQALRIGRVTGSAKFADKITALHAETQQQIKDDVTTPNGGQ